MAKPAATGAKNCPKSAIKKTGAIHSRLRRKSFLRFGTLGRRLVPVKRPAESHSQSAPSRKRDPGVRTSSLRVAKTEQSQAFEK
jgi:hypothetical protein